MTRQVLAVLSVVLAILAGCTVQSVHTDNALYDDFASPLKSDIAYAFYSHVNRDVAVSNRSRDYNNDLCQNHLQKIWRGINEYEEWALEFPDTWGRMPMGLFWGHTISMGQFEECMATYRKFSETDEIKGQYCLTRIPIAEKYQQVKPKDPTQSRISYKKESPSHFELGICVPKSCDPEFVDELMKEVLRAKLGIVADKEPVVGEQWCKRADESIEFRAIDIFAICFFSVIVFIMIVSSVYDYFMKKAGKKTHPLTTAFSVVTNAPKIFTAKRTSNPNVIECLAGIRCISMMWVVMGHNYMTLYDLPHINKNKIYNWIETPYSMVIQNGSLCVDTFFFMSGLLMLWGAFREMEKAKGKLNIPMMYFHRYIRLTPVVAVVILYIMSLYKYSGEGPMWFKMGIQDQKCSESWWASLIYVQNYAFPYSICVSQSWYLAVDTQLYVLSPLFLIPLWKWGKKAVWVIAVFGFLCLACTFATFIYNDFALFRVQDNNVSLRQTLTYYPTHTRIPTWLIGMLFGYFLFTKNRGRKIPLATKWVILGWILAFGVMLTDLWGPYWRIRPETPNAPLIEGAFFEPLSRSGWALAIGWIVWACYNGHGGIINEFLSWTFFQGFARLSYCMYVIHRIVQLVNAARLQTDTHFSDWDAILRFWHDFGITLTLSIFATLAFESPILGIEKAIFGDTKAPPKKPAVVKEVLAEDLTSVKTSEPQPSTSTDIGKAQ